MTRVLVTGGAGFIGSALVDRLLAEGHAVTVVDDLSTGRLANLDDAKSQAHPPDVVRMDIATPELDDAVAGARPEVILHLAAQADVRHSVADPVHDLTVNLLGTVRVLEACRRHDVAKIVFATSGGTIYGEPAADDLPVAEDYDGHPGSPYGASKRAVEEYLHTYAALYGLRWTALALSNVYGPRQNPEGEAGVVSIFGARMLADQPLTVFGDGEQTRDFVFVDDVVDAFVRAMTAGDGLRCNIGTGEQISVNALVAELAGLTGYTRDPEYAPARPGELQRIALDIRRAGSELGWKPRWSLAQGMAATLDWLRTTTA